MSNPTKAEWREYALLQVLQGKPVTPLGNMATADADRWASETALSQHER